MVPVFISPSFDQILVASRIKANLAKPFFNQWYNPGELTVANSSSLLENHSIDTRRKPDGFIFHTSRCGSSAIVNYFQHQNNVTTIPEAQPISVLSMINNTHVTEWNDKKKLGLSSTFDAYHKHFCPTPEDKLLIKFTSWNILDLKRIMNDYPEVPTLILFRHPIETLVSINRKKSGLINLLANSDMAFNLLGERISFQNPIELYTHVLKKSFGIIGAVSDRRNIMLLDHSRLDSEVLPLIQKFFGIPSPNKSANNTLNYYSKVQGRRARYVDDSKEKMSQADSIIIENVDNECLSDYDLIKQKSI